ncbi:Protein of unknown function [Gryllus bimaculatus]|nr:Protein of unknown function [Gryllus bimaculatus]
MQQIILAFVCETRGANYSHKYCDEVHIDFIMEIKPIHYFEEKTNYLLTIISFVPSALSYAHHRDSCALL